MSIWGNPVLLGENDASVLVSKTITQNGTYDPANDNADGYSSVTANVPNSYGQSDEGKVVSNGALVAQTARAAEITQNGRYDTTLNDAVIVNVSGGGGPSDDWTSLKTYIESSGTQYIDTDYTVKDASRFELIANVNLANPSFATLFGVRNSNVSNEAVIFAKYQGENTFAGNWSISQTRFYSGTAYYAAKALYRLSKENIYAEIESGGVSALLISGGIVTTSFTLYLFGLNQGGSQYGSVTLCSMKLYRFRIYEGSTLVHEFVPWKDENDVVCLKDTVSGNLKYNAGTGSFVFGTDSE